MSEVLKKISKKSLRGKYKKISDEQRQLMLNLFLNGSTLI